MRLSTDFHRRQLARAGVEMERKKLDGLMLMNPLSIFYLTGLWDSPAGSMERPVFLILSADGAEPTLIVSRDVDGHSETPLSEVVSNVGVYREYPYTDRIPTLTWVCKQAEDLGLRGKVVGVEDNYMPINDGLATPWFEHISGALDGTIVRAGALVSSLRITKEPEEIALIREACSYADLLVRTMSDGLIEGASEEEVGFAARALVEESMRARLETLIPSLGTGRILDGVPRGYHDVLTGEPRRELAADLPIIINCFAVVGGYHAESERCAMIGAPTERQWALFHLAIESQLTALENVRAGATCEDVDAAARRVIEGAGFDYLYGVGHGIGLLGHEPPWVREGNRMELRPGMCVTVEPGLAVRGEGSFHCSQTVLVTENGHEALTTTEEIHQFTLKNEPARSDGS